MSRPLFSRIGFNFLLGIGAEEWWTLLRNNRFAIHPRYMGRAILISAASVGNSFFHWRERRRFGEQVARTQISKPPVFILGHWRSGTTHLHNLLATDTGYFTWPNTYQAFNPLDFLANESRTSELLGKLLPRTRPGDGMAISVSSPQEDEFALALSSLCSPYLAMAFPKSANRYERYLTLDDVSENERERWKDALVQFVQKLTLKNNRTVLLKSPAHTARIRTLLEIFPDARFIHLRRHPCEVFQSTKRFFAALTDCLCLQHPNCEGSDDQIIERYRKLYDAYFADRDLIPSGRHLELSFEALETQPLIELERIYDGLGIPGFAAKKASFSAHLASVSAHRKNSFPPLDRAVSARLATAWARSFSEWNYDPAACGQPSPCATC